MCLSRDCTTQLFAGTGNFSRQSIVLWGPRLS